MSVPENVNAFYVPDGDQMVASAFTRGPWDVRLQHAGPPAALLARAMATTHNDGDRRIARITCDILRPIPVAPVRVVAEVVRPGKWVDLLDARLETEDGAVVIIARAWRSLTTEVPLPSEAITADAAPKGPENGTDEPFFPVAHSIGYHTAITWRFLEGSWTKPGPATVWMRMDVPLVEGETPAPLERVLVAADSVSGAASLLNPTEYTFPNLDLSAQLIRDPVGEWIALEARSDFTTGHTGAAYSRVYDRCGFAGSTQQTLFTTKIA